MRAYKLKHMETKHIKFVSQIHKISIKNRNIFIFPLLETEKRRGICVCSSTRGMNITIRNYLNNLLQQKQSIMRKKRPHSKRPFWLN